MLEGIKVLSENTVDTYIACVCIIVLGSILLLLSIVLSFLCFSAREIFQGIFAILLGVIGIIVVIFGINECQNEPQIQYKVIIDDTVNFKEFNDRYEIKDQEGEIYTIVEREK